MRASVPNPLDTGDQAFVFSCRSSPMLVECAGMSEYRPQKSLYTM